MGKGLVGAQVKNAKPGASQVHCQVIVDAAGGYLSGAVLGVPAEVMADILSGQDTTSAGGTGTKYFKLAVDPDKGIVLADDAPFILTKQEGK